MVARTMQRHATKNRPPLPATRRDLILQAAHSKTSDGRPFVLVDDGLDDRIFVFSNELRLQRYDCLSTMKLRMNYKLLYSYNGKGQEGINIAYHLAYISHFTIFLKCTFTTVTTDKS